MPASFIYQVTYIAFFVSLLAMAVLLIARALRESYFDMKYLNRASNYVVVSDAIKNSDAISNTDMLDIYTGDSRAKQGILGARGEAQRDEKKVMQDIIADIQKTKDKPKEEVFLNAWWQEHKSVLLQVNNKAILLSYNQKDLTIIAYTGSSVDVLKELEKNVAGDKGILKYIILQKRSLYFKGDIDKTSAFSSFFSHNEKNTYKHLYILPLMQNGKFIGSLIVAGDKENTALKPLVIESSI